MAVAILVRAMAMALRRCVIPAALTPIAELLHAVSCAAVYLMVGFSAQAVLQTRPSAAKNVSRVSGAVMVLIAVVLLAEQAYS